MQEPRGGRGETSGDGSDHGALRDGQPGDRLIGGVDTERGHIRAVQGGDDRESGGATDQILRDACAQCMRDGIVDVNQIEAVVRGDAGDDRRQLQGGQ